jgi:hypothetical protein
MAGRTAAMHVRFSVLTSQAVAQRKPSSRRTAHAAAVAVIGLVTLLRIIYLVHVCPYDLAPDEAHYWDWSRQLDWSYYSKGPLVAWLIRASCQVFGDTMPAVRLPAVLSGSLTLLGLYVLVSQVYQQAGLALAYLIGAIFFPALAAGALLMTIDAPYVCCWTWALVLALAAVRMEAAAMSLCDSRRLIIWCALGGIIGLGILAKYTMVLFLPSLMLFALTSRRHRSLLARPGVWLMIAVATLACLPILIWNWQHDWITLRHVTRQAGLENLAVHWRGPLEYLAGQAGMLLGFGFVAWLISMVRRLRTVPSSGCGIDTFWFLWCLSAPVFLIFLVFSLKTRTQVNWPATAYLSGMVLVVGWVVEGWNERPGWKRSAFRSCACLTSVVAVAGTVILHDTSWLYPVHAAVQPAPRVRQWDPTCRLRGWQTLAGEIECLRHQLRNQGEEPLLAASGWALPGEIAFYQHDQPQVYSFARAARGRFSQYDLWRPNPMTDPEQFYGRTFIYIGELAGPVQDAFERVGSSRYVKHFVCGHEVSAWQITVCYGFRGFGDVMMSSY